MVLGQAYGVVDLKDEMILSYDKCYCILSSL